MFERLCKYYFPGSSDITAVVGVVIEIINNTRVGIVIFFRSKTGTLYWGANSSPGYFDIGSRTKDLRSFHRVFIL